MSVYSYQPKGERGRNFIVGEKGEKRNEAVKRGKAAAKAKHEALESKRSEKKEHKAK